MGVLDSFQGFNGKSPEAVISSSTGNLYGITASGGASGDGTLFEMGLRETETVIAASPSLTTSAGGTVVVGGAGTLSDSATLSGGYNPTGTITFTLYAPNGTTVVDTVSVTVNGNGTYQTPNGYTPTSAGTYEWVASYSGDTDNNLFTTTKGSEPETVPAPVPPLSTTAGSTVVVGASSLTDSATLSGAYNPTGTITFALYAPNSTTVVDTETDTVSGNGTYTTPNGYLPAATGIYEWVVTYSGDSNNNTVSSTKGNEPETVIPASPTLGTVPDVAVAIGSGTTLTDSATLLDGYNPTGTITFTLYAPDDTTVVDTESVTVSGNGTYSTPGGYLPVSLGTYQWVASYGGDSNNNSVAESLGNEPVAVEPASPTLIASAGGNVVLGSGDNLTDSATLTGGDNPTGTITFTLFAPGGTSVLDTETVAVSGNGTYSTPDGFLPTEPGNYQWIASYSGDSDNNPASAVTGSSSLISINSASGANPRAGLLVDSAGNLYGTTSGGDFGRRHDL